MANYADYINYFEQLAEEHVKIQHNKTADKGKKFFRMNIEELISGSLRSLVTDDSTPFIVFINYITDYGQTHQPLKTNQLMFYVLAGQKTRDWDSETTARDTCEVVAQNFLARIRHDSMNGDSTWNSSADVIKSRLVAAEFKGSANTYHGWQVSLSVSSPTTDLCYDENKWIIE